MKKLLAELEAKFQALFDETRSASISDFDKLKSATETEVTSLRAEIEALKAKSAQVISVDYSTELESLRAEIEALKAKSAQ